MKTLLFEENPGWNDRFIFSHWRGKVSVRNQKYRLDHEGGLFDLEIDRGQTTDISALFPDVMTELLIARQDFESKVLSELPNEDTRTFPLGHPDAIITQIPARDGQAHGNIQRSNRFPNCSFFTNWTSLEDRITWDVEVLRGGRFRGYFVLYLS